MAYLQILGAETGDLSELHAATSCSVQSSIKRTGAYAYQFNTSSIPGWGRIRKHAGTGGFTIFTETNAYFTGYLYVSSRPSAAEEDIWAFHGAAFNAVSIGHTTSGTLKLYYHNATDTKTLVGTSAAISTDTWHLLEVGISNYATGSANGSVGLKIDGVSVLSATSIRHTSSSTDKLESCFIGSNLSGAASASNVTWDDIAISDSAYPGAGEVRVLKPNAAGDYDSWTNTYTALNEAPPDGDTTYRMGNTNNVRLSTQLDDCSTGGVKGTIAAVKAMIYGRGGSGITTGFTPSVRHNSFNYDWGDPPISDSVYNLYARVYTTQPGGGAWSTSTVDGLQIGANTNSTEHRVTAIYAMVWCTGQINTTVTPGTLALTTTRYTPSAKVNNIATPGALSLTTTRYAPTAPVNSIATPGALSAALAAYAPTVTVGLAVIPGTIATALTAYTPTLINPQSATPGAASLTLTPYSPSAVLKSIVTPTATTLVLTAHAPSTVMPVYVAPGAASLSLTPYAPTLVFVSYITIGATALAIATYGLNIYLPGSAFGARQYWRSTQHKEYTKLVPYRDYRRFTQHKDYIKSGKWVDRA